MSSSSKQKVVSWFAGGLLIVLTAFGMGLADPASAGEGTMTGYLQHRSEFSLHYPSRYAVSELLGSAEMNYTFDNKLAFHTILRGRYDGVYDLRDDFKRDVAPADRDKLRKDGEVREIYFDYKPTDDISFRVGRQVVIWGESDGLRLMDMINPLDLKWGYLTRDFEDIRTPLNLLRFNYRLPGLESKMAGLELIWIPVDFEVNEIPPSGSAWAPESPAFFNSQVGTLLNLGLLPVLTDERRARTLKNSRFGAKLAGNIAGTDVSLNYLYTYADSPVFYFNGIGAAPEPFIGTFNISQRYPWKSIAGITFNHDFGNIVARGEVAYEFKSKFQNLTTPDWTDESDYVKSMIGFDWSLRIPGFNLGKSFFISGQVFNFHIMDYNENIINIPYGYRVKKDETFFTLLANTAFFNDKLKPEIFVAYDPTYSSYWVKPKLGIEFGSSWRYEMGTNIFGGKNTQRLPFAAFNRDSTVYAQIRRMF